MIEAEAIGLQYIICKMSDEELNTYIRYAHMGGHNLYGFVVAAILTTKIELVDQQQRAAVKPYVDLRIYKTQKPCHARNV